MGYFTKYLPTHQSIKIIKNKKQAFEIIIQSTLMDF